MKQALLFSTLLLLVVLPARAQQVASLANSGANSTPVAAPRPKRVAPLRTSELPDGARITITADAPLDDYSAYRAGDSFFVLLPHANVNAVQRDLALLRGLVSTHVEQRGADALISFQLAVGTTAHVKQNFNRLDVILSAQDPQEHAWPCSGSRFSVRPD